MEEADILNEAGALKDGSAHAETRPEATAARDITRHTASLWKYVEISGAEPENYSEYCARNEKIRGGEIIAAKARGKKHKHKGANCDDWYEVETLDDWTFIAVSDGAGSKRFSRVGARVSCQEATSYIKEEMRRFKEERPGVLEALSLPLDHPFFTNLCTKLANIVQKGVISAYYAVQNAFEERSMDERYASVVGRALTLTDFAATLLVAVILPVKVGRKKEHVLISCQVGDGMIAAVRESGPFADALCLLGEADGGSYAGETVFLTSGKMKNIETLMKRTRITRREISAVLVMTDGVADDYYPSDPELLRLYIDLQLNGVLGNLDAHTFRDFSENLRYIKRVPEPVRYPWINDPGQQIALQYAKRVLADTGLPLEALWHNKDVLYAAYLHTFGADASGGTPKEKLLEVWLDNYVERGSFDDRTLVIFRKRRG